MDIDRARITEAPYAINRRIFGATIGHIFYFDFEVNNHPSGHPIVRMPTIGDLDIFRESVKGADFLSDLLLCCSNEMSKLIKSASSIVITNQNGERLFEHNKE